MFCFDRILHKAEKFNPFLKENKKLYSWHSNYKWWIALSYNQQWGSAINTALPSEA